MIYLDHSICTDKRAALTVEWISPNSRSGYSASTVAGAYTRQEHGLLVSAIVPPHGQTVLLAGVEEKLVLEKSAARLSCLAADEAERHDVMRYLQSFAWDRRNITSEYLFDGLKIKRVISVLQGLDAIILSYQVLEIPPQLRKRPMLLEISPWLAYTLLNDPELEHPEKLDLNVYIIDDKVRVDPRPPLPPIFFTHEAEVFVPEPGYMDHLPLPAGVSSGPIPEATLGTPGTFIYQLSQERPVFLAVSATEPIEAPQRAIIVQRRKRNPYILKSRLPATGKGPLTKALLEASKDFIVSGERGRRWLSVGYPGGGMAWDDALLALPGMLIFSGLHDVAREVLLCAARSMYKGRLPHCQADAPPKFPDSVKANLAATLRFIDSCELYLRKSTDVRTTRKQLYPACRDALAHILSGSAGTRVDPEGLLESRAPSNTFSRQAGISGDGLTLDRAFLVSHNALWFRALVAVRDMATEFNDKGTAHEASTLVDKVSASFVQRFWNNERGCLFRAVCCSVPDPTLTPHQVLALTARPALLDREKTLSVLSVIERELLTPRGLRTLSPAEPGYAGLECLLYSNYPDLHSRGSAYPWLLGPFAEAYLSANGFSKDAKLRISTMLSEFNAHLREGAMGHIAERFDGDVPHAPRGLPASAASVGELLRICLEFLDGSV
ncbi:MAG: hypothetical protein GXP49_17300 [Deltaproteobacteria bacterium]|nr:hypothetical protein [Deltaproteobacteria bacterium]